MSNAEQKYNNFFYWNEFVKIDNSLVESYIRELIKKDKHINVNSYSHVFDKKEGKKLQAVIFDMLNNDPIRESKTVLENKNKQMYNSMINFIKNDFPDKQPLFNFNFRKRNVEKNISMKMTSKKVHSSQYGNISGIMHDAFKDINDLLTEEMIYFSKNKTINKIGKLKIASEELIYMRRRNMIVPVKHINLIFFLWSHDIKYLKLLTYVIYDYISYFSTTDIHLHIHLISYPILQYSFTSEFNKKKLDINPFWDFYSMNNNRDLIEYSSRKKNTVFKDGDHFSHLVRNIMLSKFTYLFSSIPKLSFDLYLTDDLRHKFLYGLQRVHQRRLKYLSIFQKNNTSYCINQFIYFLPYLKNRDVHLKQYDLFHEDFNYGILNYSKELAIQTKQTGSSYMIECNDDLFTITKKDYYDNEIIKRKSFLEVRKLLLKSIIRIFEPGLEGEY